MKTIKIFTTLFLFLSFLEGLPLPLPKDPKDGSQTIVGTEVESYICGEETKVINLELNHQFGRMIHDKNVELCLL